MEKKKYKTEETGHYSGVIPKMTVMQPTVVNVSNPPARENVSSEEMLCRSDSPERYQQCDDYNSVFCHHECEFGPKTELPLNNG